jgi:hypothetical protein
MTGEKKERRDATKRRKVPSKNLKEQTANLASICAATS